MIARLRRRFIGITMCSVTIVLAILMGVVNTVNFVRTDQRAAQLLSILAENGGSFPELNKPGERNPTDGAPADRLIGTDKPHDLITTETPYETRYFSVVLNADGTLSSVNTGRIAAVSTDEAVAMARACAQSGDTDGYLGNYKYQLSAQGDETMYLFLDCTRDLKTVRTFLLSCLLVSLCGVAGVLVLIVALSRRAVRPVAESYDKQKRFITDAGHELKTPLTIIDSCTEVIEMEQGKSKWTEGIRGQVRRLDALTKSMVALARMDEQNTDIKMELFSLSDAAAETMEPFVLLAENSGKQFVLHIQPDISYRGNEMYIRQLLSILADNAVKYVSDDGKIYFSVKKKGKKCVIVCDNAADGLSRGSQDALFDRFYRGDVSRSRETGGSGIGLSMAQSIVLAHGGKISAKSEDGTRLTITVLL